MTVNAQPLNDDPELHRWYESSGFLETDPSRLPHALITDLTNCEPKMPSPDTRVVGQLAAACDSVHDPISPAPWTIGND